MARVYTTYDIPGGNAGVSHVAGQTSTGTADVKTFTAPKGATGFVISVETNACRLTWDGQTPDATHGLVFPKDAIPSFQPIGRDLKVVSTIAGNSVVQIAWVA